MRVVSLFVRHLGASISTLGSVLMIGSFLFPFVVARAGGFSSGSASAYEFLLPELFVALVILGTTAPAIFSTVSRPVTWTRALTILLNIPLFLLLGFLVAFSMSGGSPDGGIAIDQAGGEVAGPGLSILGFGVLLSVIGGVISYFIAEIEKIRRWTKRTEQSQRS